jgi:hypothetical protein
LEKSQLPLRFSRKNFDLPTVIGKATKKTKASASANTITNTTRKMTIKVDIIARWLNKLKALLKSPV